MSYRNKNKIIEAICRGDILYIKNTGIAVTVTYFGTDVGTDWTTRKIKKVENLCEIEFINTPTRKALDLCEKFHIKRNTVSKKIELDGYIKIINLSISPFEGKAAKVLYEKNKKAK